MCPLGSAIFAEYLGRYLPRSVGSFLVKIVSAVTYPVGDSTTVELWGYAVPKEFVAYFLVEDEVATKDGECWNWSVELRFRIGEFGTPRIQQITHRGLTRQKEIITDHLNNYICHTEHFGVLRKQIAYVESNLPILQDHSLVLVLHNHIPSGDGGWTLQSDSRNFDESQLKAFRKEMRNRTAKTKLTPEFLKFVAETYANEIIRSRITGDRCTTTEAIWEATGFNVSLKTVESWVAKARNDGYLIDEGEKYSTVKVETRRRKIKSESA